MVSPTVTTWVTSAVTSHTEGGPSLTKAARGVRRGAGFRCQRHGDSQKSLNHIFSDATDLLSASMFVKSPAEFIPIQDESSNFGHVARKHCLHA